MNSSAIIRVANIPKRARQVLLYDQTKKTKRRRSLLTFSMTPDIVSLSVTPNNEIVHQTSICIQILNLLMISYDIERDCHHAYAYRLTLPLLGLSSSWASRDSPRIAGPRQGSSTSQRAASPDTWKDRMDRSGLQIRMLVELELRTYLNLWTYNLFEVLNYHRNNLEMGGKLSLSNRKEGRKLEGEISKKWK